ncbi:MAG: hypothetical protein GXP01_00745 [Alphaproteobacteria bacterium]|nr:hypothetical protein [Alphaproteobacteria bacterium]
MKRIILAGVAALAMGGAAHAGSNGYGSTGFSSGFDWEGLYIGGSAGVALGSPTLSGSIGYNKVSNDLLFGIEGSGIWYTAGAFGGEVQGRLGILASSDVLLYGAAGLGVINPGATYGLLGVGMELAVSDQMTIGGQLSATSWGAGTAKVSLRWYLN